MIEGINHCLISLKAVRRLILDYMSLAASSMFQSISCFLHLPFISHSFLQMNAIKRKAKGLPENTEKLRQGIQFLLLLFQSDCGEERHKNYFILKQSIYISEHFCLSSFSDEKGGPLPPVVIPSYLTCGAVKRKNNFIIMKLPVFAAALTSFANKCSVAIAPTSLTVQFFLFLHSTIKIKNNLNHKKILTNA